MGQIKRLLQTVNFVTWLEVGDNDEDENSWISVMLIFKLFLITIYNWELTIFCQFSAFELSRLCVYLNEQYELNLVLPKRTNECLTT